MKNNLLIGLFLVIWLGTCVVPIPSCGDRQQLADPGMWAKKTVKVAEVPESAGATEQLHADAYRQIRNRIRAGGDKNEQGVPMATFGGHELYLLQAPPNIPGVCNRQAGEGVLTIYAISPDGLLEVEPGYMLDQVVLDLGCWMGWWEE